jgi:hypothetical protein
MTRDKQRLIPLNGVRVLKHPHPFAYGYGRLLVALLEVIIHHLTGHDAPGYQHGINE